MLGSRRREGHRSSRFCSISKLIMDWCTDEHARAK